MSTIPLRGDWSYPTQIRFGAGRIAELPDVCGLVGMTRPLFVTDPGLARMPIAIDAIERLRHSGLDASLFADLQPDPVGQNVRDGVGAFRKNACDGVIAFGGGSALDTGKSIALLARQPGDLWDHDGRWRSIPASEVPPIVSVPTTAGTGSEVGRATVITHEEEQVKKILLNPAMMPRMVIADPELTLSLPPHLTAATGMDALAHALEALSAPFHHPMADGIAVEGIRLIKEWLPMAVRDGANLEARSAMLAAAMMGAAAFQKGLGAIHALSHPIGVTYHVHHGLTNAIVMPYVVVFNRPAIEERIVRLSRYLDLPRPSFEGFVDWLLELRAAIDIPHTLRDVGVKAADIPALARAAFADPNAEENPVPVGPPELETLFARALDGDLGQ